MNNRLPPNLGMAVDFDAVRGDPLKFLVDNAAAHGDIFAYQIDHWNAVVLNHPAYVRHFLHADNVSYTKIGTPDLMMLRPMLGEGLMTSEGETWLRNRRAAQPAFHHWSIEGYARHMVDTVEELTERWATIADTGHPIEVDRAMSDLTFKIVARCLFGVDLTDEGTDFGEAVGTMNEYMGHFDPHDVGGRLRFEQAVLTINRIVQRIVIERLIVGSEEQDLLSHLMASLDPADERETRDRRLRDQVFTFLMAGHETTAKALTWTLYLLGQHPEVEARLRKEVNGVLDGRAARAEDVDQLSYTWMVIQESIRLYPPVWLMSRISKKDNRIDGYRISAGTLVVISPYLLHRHPSYWNAPDAFDPERFNPIEVSGREPYSYIPFSAGPRMCIGKPFATLEAVLVLASLVQRFSLRLVPGHIVEPEALVTLRPRHGLPMTVESAGLAQ